MPRLGIFNRHDDGLHIRLRSTRTTATVKGIRLGRGKSWTSGHRPSGKPSSRPLGRVNARGISVPSPASSSRRCVVKVKYAVAAVRAKGLVCYIQKDVAEPGERQVVAENHTHYIGRDTAGEHGRTTELFTADGPGNAEEFIARARLDERIWHVIVSPEDGAILDLPTFTRQLVAQVQEDVKLQLDWVAAAHFDTDNPHVHVLVRGRDLAGEPFYLRPDYIKVGLRQRASELATKHVELGLTHEPVAQVRQQAQEITHKQPLAHADDIEPHGPSMNKPKSKRRPCLQC